MFAARLSPGAVGFATGMPGNAAGTTAGMGSDFSLAALGASARGCAGAGAVTEGGPSVGDTGEIWAMVGVGTLPTSSTEEPAVALLSGMISSVCTTALSREGVRVGLDLVRGGLGGLGDRCEFAKHAVDGHSSSRVMTFTASTRVISSCPSRC